MSRPRLIRLGACAVAAAVAGLALSLAIAAASTQTVSPRDDCGGFNGHVVWSGGSSPYIQVYGEVWDTTCSGSSSVWLSWDSPSYHNINAGHAAEPNTAGVNYKTATQQAPTHIKVTVCSTHGSWHCGTPVAVGATPPPTSTTPPPTTTPAPIPTAPVGTTPVPQPSPHPRALRIKMTIRWTWDRASTWLRGVKIGHFPGKTRLLVRCRGNRCPRPATARATGPRRIRRLLAGLKDHRYRPGDRVLVSLQAPGWVSERARIVIRRGRLPKINLLG